MLSTERHSAILEQLAQRRVVAVDDLSTRLGVSPSTIRRDLDALDTAGLLRRVRGGGTVVVSPGDSLDDTVHYRDIARVRHEHHDRIGAAAANLVQDGQVVILDIGTTSAAVARHLRGRPVTIVSASVGVLDELRDEAQPELIMLGGIFRPTYLSLVGPMTEQALRSVRADIAFLGTSGVTANLTVLDSTGAEVPIKHAIMREATKSVLVATADKFPGAGVYSVCSATDFDAVITSADPNIPTLVALSQTQTEVISV